MVSGCVVLCDLKHDNEQLYAISIVDPRDHKWQRTMEARKSGTCISLVLRCRRRRGLLTLCYLLAGVATSNQEGKDECVLYEWWCWEYRR